MAHVTSTLGDVQEGEGEVCPVCEERTGGGEEYKDHLKACLQQNVPVVKSNRQVLLEARGSLVCDDQLKDEPSEDIKTPAQETDEDDESSEDEEAVDARQLYPCKEKKESQYFEFLEEGEELLPADVVKSIDIMQKSCFSSLNLSAGKRKRYDCKSCRTVFNTKREFAGHLYAHTFTRSVRPEPVLCSGCGLTLRHREAWQDHVQASHCIGLAKTIFGCRLCRKMFTRKDNLRDHLKYHAGARARRRTSHSCLHCGASFCGEAVLLIHNKSHQRK